MAKRTSSAAAFSHCDAPHRAPKRGSLGDAALPQPFAAWFAKRGWAPRPHQLALKAAADAQRSALLIAPTGAGKTLAGFLPSLVRLAARGKRDKSACRGAGLDTLYLSPLKALATDIARNLEAPIAEMALAIRTETRTGDTSVQRRQRQRVAPPDILLTTPEQLALLLSHGDAGHLFADLRTVVLDELHALAGSKRGDMLALSLTRLRTLAPQMRAIGLSATVARPSELRAYLTGQAEPETRIDLADMIVASGGARPNIEIIEGEEPARDVNAIVGQVGAEAYFGDRSHYFVEVPGVSRRVAVALQNAVRTLDNAESRGRQVWLTWTTESSVLLPRE